MKQADIPHSNSEKFIILVQQLKISSHDLNESTGAAICEPLQNH
jgi:hypothetical protein